MTFNWRATSHIGEDIIKVLSFQRENLVATKMDILTREQTTIALNIYCRIPFSKANSSNSKIIRIAYFNRVNPKFC